MGMLLLVTNSVLKPNGSTLISRMFNENIRQLSIGMQKSFIMIIVPRYNIQMPLSRHMTDVAELRS